MGIEPMTPSLPRKCSTSELHRLAKAFCTFAFPILKGDAEGSQKPSNLFRIRAGDETRTRDPDLGRVMLYQLSYSRVIY